MCFLGILTKINDLQNYINNLPAGAFTGKAANPRETLLDVLTVAANYAADGEFDDVRTELENNFTPYVDGLNRDDLIVNAAAALEAFNSAQAIIDEVTVTSISVAPASVTLGPGGTQEFTAQCTYSNQYTEDCTARATWTSSDSTVGAIDAAGVLTAVSIGTCIVNASYSDVTSNDATVVVSIFFLEDNFDAGYVDPEKWNDFTNFGTMAQAGGVLNIRGASNMYSELATTNYFNIEPGESLSFEVDLSLWQSSGQYYMMGFGITDETYAGIAIGLAGGTTLSGATLYYASPLRGAGGSMVLPAGVRSGRFRVEYQNGAARLYRDGALQVSFAADLDGKRVSFFMFASAGWGTSSYNTNFDNFMTNQLFPGETGIKITNNTRPFGADGSGMFASGDSYTITIASAPGQADVQAGIIDPSNSNYMVPPAALAETAPGVYEINGSMPSLASGAVAAEGTDDGNLAVTLHTRKIATSGAAALRIAAMTGQPEAMHPLLNIFPADILPVELTAGGE